MRIAALGRTRMLYDTIRSLADRGHTIPLIATCPASPESGIRERDFAALAAEQGAVYFEARSLNSAEAVGRLLASGAELAVSVNWLTLIGPAACGAFPGGILNAHAGDLPRYRGNAPVAWAILNGEDQIGVTIHQMDPHELDAGSIIVKRFLPLTPTTLIGDVFSALDRLVPALFLEAVTGLSDDTIRPQPQTGEPLRCYPRHPEDGRLVWELPAEFLGRLVRASSEPFPGAFAEYRGQRFTVWRARAEPWQVPSLAVPGQVVFRDPGGEVGIATGDGVLMLHLVELEDSGRVAPGILIRSTRHRLG